MTLTKKKILLSNYVFYFLLAKKRSSPPLSPMMCSSNLPLSNYGKNMDLFFLSSRFSAPGIISERTWSPSYLAPMIKFKSILFANLSIQGT